MEREFNELRKAIDSLETSIRRNEEEDIDMNVRLIKNITNNIKDLYWETHSKAEIDKPVVATAKPYRVINTIEFLYKPMTYLDVYEGNNLERFSEERTDELIATSAIDAHNSFWQMNQLINGNVYGSVPSELLSPDEIGGLIRCGWKKVNVDILEFETADPDEILKLSNSRFKNFILVFEGETKSHLLLKYNL